MSSKRPASPSRSQTLITTLLALALLATPLSATWSILIVDTATGEVAVGIATCLTFFDLRDCCVVVVPEAGVAAAQSFVGPLSLRQLIRAELQQGTPPAQILAMLAAADPGHQTRQYGIADVQGRTVTFTGTGAGAWAGGLTGQTGTLVYAIQGNVLTGMPVITNAEQAILNTPGDVGQKLMAAMNAARVMGGDGRCSCSQASPTACGSPPPSFNKSAHIGLMIVSRPGDFDAPCNPTAGCAAGSYYLDLNIANQPASAPDPVLQLQSQFTAWRAAQVGRPDHFQSSAGLSTSQLLANGVDTSTATVVLRDLLGTQLSTSPSLTVALDPASTASDAQVGAVTPLGNGTYTFDVTSGLTPGQVVLDVIADDGQGPVLVSPRPEITIGEPFGVCGAGAVSDGQGGLFDVLRIDGSPGVGRVVRVGINQPFTLQMLAPPLVPPGIPPFSSFLLWARAGVPAPSEVLHLGASIGRLCFSPPPLPVVAPTLLIADSFNGTGLLPATVAPWSATIPGLPVPLDLSLQGIILENLPLDLATTNAVLLRVELLPAPTISQVTPLSAAPGATVSVQGTGFQPGAVVTVGGASATPLTITDTLLTFAMPAGVPCNAQLTVTNVDNQSATTPFNPQPVITSTIFGSGPAAGGALLFIIGSGFSTGSAVTIGGAPATVNGSSATSISVTTPPGSPGSVPVVVTSAGGCTAQTTYTYQ